MEPTMTTVNDMTWTIGGAQGSGVDSSANVFARACAYGGLHVYGNREYYSNIMGEHSYFKVRVKGAPVYAPADPIHLLATFDAETVFRHARHVTADGAVLYDPDHANTAIEDVPTLEAPVRERLRAHLAQHGAGETVSDLLEVEARRGVLLVPVPFADILKDVQEKYAIDQLSKITKMVNMIAVGASFGLLDFRGGVIERALQSVFRTKPKVAEMNTWAARRAYDMTLEAYGDGFPYRLEMQEAGAGRLLLAGSQAAALGKIAAGCRFQTYYPITPASDESEFIELHEIVAQTVENGGAREVAEEGHHLEANGKSGVVVVQTEDEIAAITMATGAALAGTRAATATSGPGFCLMVEGLGWAGINEVALVVTLYQRCGPSTGMPTRHEQGDLRFALHAGHGDFPRIVLASGDLEETFYDAMKAFNLAERYQVPVIHLVDKAIANSSATLSALDPTAVKIERGAYALPGDGPYRRFRLTETGISPRVPLGQPDTLFWNTGDEHDERGHITEDPSLRVRMMDKRMGKLDLALREIPPEDQAVYRGDADATTVVVSWGSTKGVLLETLDLLRGAGHKVGFLQVRLMSPFPSPLVTEVLADRKNIVGVEMNHSAQLAGLVREKTGVPMTHTIVKYNGRPISANEMRSALSAVLEGTAPRRQVLTHGV
jgi:2-oxoglutarate ferredoxin oxidoreductase subunit alpha